MEYHKDQFAFTDRMEYLQAPLPVQAAHAWLIRFCARRECGGRILASKAWKDREWAIATNGQLRARDVAAVIAAGLATYAGDDLSVGGYDAVGEAECQRERRRAREWRLKKRGEPANPIAHADANADSDHDVPRGSTGTETRARTPTQTGTRTRTVPIRESDQTSPDQSRPVQTRSDSDSDPARTPTPDPRLAVVVALGGSLVGDDGIDLTERWLIAIAELSAEQIRAVFREGPALIGHGIRYPNGFTQAVTALRAADAAQRAEAAAAERAERATQDRERATVIAAAVDGWLASPDGAKTRARLTSTDRDALAVLRDAGELTGFIALSRRFPELARVAGEALKAAEASV